MSTDYAVQIRMANLNAAFSGLDAGFLSQLSTKELQDLLTKVTIAESNIRQELKNVNKKPH
ncbi:MAG: hypothetical protein HFJ29_06460 [Clostridia bacterium]|nr:hypothetical protein [Clostridia bacterium]